MLASLRPRLTYANVISTLCLFLGLGGGAYAALTLPANSVGTKQLKNGAVTGPKLAKGTIPGARWALISAGGSVLAQSGGISVSRHITAVSPGSYFLNFGSSVHRRAILVSAAAEINSGGYGETVEAAHCGGGTDGIPCFPALNHPNEVHVQTSLGGVPTDYAFYIAVLP